MYFKDRHQAGQQLAAKLQHYRYENTAVVALSDGGVIIGAEIAKALHCVLTMLLIEEITLPGEHNPLAVINQDGGFTYNNMFSTGQIEGFAAEYRTYIEQEKIQKVHAINRLLGDGGLIRPDLLYGRNVILVSDGLQNGLSLDAAADFLKPIKLERLIVATPLASVSAVDRMHLLADEIVCLSVVENFMTIGHYYESNAMPSHEQLVKTIETIVLNWK